MSLFQPLLLFHKSTRLLQWVEKHVIAVGGIGDI